MIPPFNIPGLDDAIGAAGQSVIYSEDHAGVGAWAFSDLLAVQAVIDGYTVDDAKTWLKSQLRIVVTDQYDKGVLLSYGASPSQHEANGWLLKEAQALAYQAWLTLGGNGEPPATTKIDPRVTGNNPLETEITAVLAKAAALHGLEDAINAWAQAKKDLINSALTFDELAAIDIYSGAPV